MNKLCLIGACLLSLLFADVVDAEVRIWREKNGRQFTGDFVHEKFEQFYFRGEDGNLFKIPADNMEDVDKNHIRSMIPPKISAQFSRKETPSPRPVYYDEEMRMQDISGRVTVKRRSAPPFTGILQGELYIVGAEVDNSYYKMMDQYVFAVELPEDRGVPFTYNTFTQFRQYLIYDLNRGQTYEGYALFIYAPSGELLDLQTNLSFLKEDGYEKIRKLKAGQWFNRSFKKVSPPRPSSQGKKQLK